MQVAAQASHRRARPTTPCERAGAHATLLSHRHCRASGRAVVRTRQPAARPPLGQACYTTALRAGARASGLLSQTATPPLAGRAGGRAGTAHHAAALSVGGQRQWHRMYAAWSQLL